jgi:CheY-like chemotaxis protein
VIQDGFGSPGEELRLLLVADDPEVAAGYQAELELDGYSVQVASDSLTALGIAAADPPDLVFLDQRLRWNENEDVVKALRRHERTRSVPVVVLATSEEPDPTDRNADPYLVVAPNQIVRRRQTRRRRRV